MSEYILEAFVPFEQPEQLYSGSEEGLREYLNGHKKEKIRKTLSGKSIRYWTIEGYCLDDLSVLIAGPEVRSYLE